MRHDDEPDDLEVLHEPADDERNETEDRDFGWEEGDPADRRKDPLRKP